MAVDQAMWNRHLTSQVETIIKELKKKNFSDTEIFCHLVKTKQIPGKDWKENVVMDIVTYHTFMRLLIKHVH